jgi:8-oxo-dGTP diphosphatase
MSESKEKKYCYEYARPAVACDCVIISKTEKEILLIQRKHDPYKNLWALPGGFMEIDETAEEAASRELFEEAGVEISAGEMKPVAVFSAVNRDPRTRLLSLSYLAFIDKNEVKHTAGDDAEDAGWYSLEHLPEMAFDHKEIIKAAKKRYQF